MAPNWKPLAATRRLKRDENANKQKARRRDGHRCRFPLCGCRRLGLRLEVSHLAHKGAGGNPTGSRNTTPGLILMCVQRHQDGAVSVHKGTMRAKPLTRQGADGPVAWKVHIDVTDAIIGKAAGVITLPRGQGWVEVARENAIGQLEPLHDWQAIILTSLAEMAL